MIKKILSILKFPSKSDFILHLFVVLMVLFGSVMALSAGMDFNRDDIATGINLDPLINEMIKKLLLASIGYFIMLFAAKFFSLRLMRKYMWLIVIGTGVLLFGTIFVESSTGANAWYVIPGFGSIQPSEFSKVVILMVMAFYLGEKSSTKLNWKELLKRPFCIIMIYCLIVGILQRDFGTALVMFALGYICFFISSNPNLKKVQFYGVGITVVLFILAAYLISPDGINVVKKITAFEYQAARFESSLNPFENPYGSGYQLINGLVSFSTGGLNGIGFGQSIQKYGYLFAADTDFILAIIVEELGMFGFAIVVLGSFIIVQRLIKYALLIQSTSAKMILFGTASYLVIHFFLNVGGVTGLIPLTGVPLLMISTGGSSLFAFMMAVGVCQALISQYNKGELQ